VRNPRWREWRRFLLATLALALAYSAVEYLVLWGYLRLSYTSWRADHVAEEYAQEATAVAASSRASEAALSPEHPPIIFQLGVRYGYASQWVAGIWATPRPQSVDRSLQEMQLFAQALGLGEIEPLAARSGRGFDDMTQRLENDAGGVAARLEHITSLRLRHLFMLGVHAGNQFAMLEASSDVIVPAAKWIGMHGTLAGVRQPMWRALARVNASNLSGARTDYRAAIAELDQDLLRTALSAAKK
jgi:hypothetical protein